MYFALAKSTGDTVTTAANPDGSPRTSAVPAPTVFLPDVEPSTSRGVGGTSANTAPSGSNPGSPSGSNTGAPSESNADAPSESNADAQSGSNADAPSGSNVDAPSGSNTDGRRTSPDKHRDSDSGVGEPQITLEDFDMSTDDESDGAGFSLSVGDYILNRNLNKQSTRATQVSKDVVEYVNLKFIENNFRSMGLDFVFDKNDITKATHEFESFEIWFSHVKEYAVDKKYIRDLRLPLFCHLYLNLYTQRNHKLLQLFLKKFEYLFTSSRGAVYLQELKNVTDVLNLSPHLEYFRQNKFSYGATIVFINKLYDFFNLNVMLRVVFQEWFDISYTNYEDPKKVFNECYKNNLIRLNNLEKAYAPKQNNNVITSKIELCKKTLNSSQSNNSSKANNSENNFYNNQRASTSKDYFVGHQNSSSSDQESNSSNDQYSKLANSSDEDLQEEVTNSEEDESVENSQMSVESSEQSDENSEQSDENSEQSIESSVHSIQKTEQSSSEDHCFEPRSKKKNDKRKHKKHNRDRASSYERESRRLKKLRGENDDTGLQSRSRSHQENATFCEESFREEQNSSEPKERIILRIARKSNKLSVIISNTAKESNDPENPMLENSSEKEQISSDGKKSRKHRRKHKSRSKNKSVTDNNICSRDTSNEISNDEEKHQKRQKKSGKSKSTSDDNNQLPDEEEKTNKVKNHHKTNDKAIYNKIDDNSSLSESESSSKDSSEKYSSMYSFFDEENEMRKYMKNKKKSAQDFSYKASCHMKYTKITKIELKNFDDDLCLHATRQIVLKNCNKLSCSILTSDQKCVVAGSLDSLIYLWERAESVVEQTGDVLHSIENINHSNFTSSVQGNNLFEYFDKSAAFVLRGHGGPIFDLAELPSAKILLSASNDKTYRAWDMVSKCCLEVYNEYEHRTWCIAACPISLQVATGSCEGAGCLWFLNYKRPLRIFTGHLDDILVIKFHPNQVLLATGSSDKTVRVFELSTGECHRLLIGHSDYITCLEFQAQKPNCLASAALNGEIVIWDLPSSEMIWKIRVGNVSFTNLLWLTTDVLLASITSGLVLKCDTTLNYSDSSCKVKGFETRFDRLMSLQMIDNKVYTIGIPDKLGCLKSIPKIHKETDSQIKNELEKSNKKISPLSKLFFPKQRFKNSTNLEKFIQEFKSSTLNRNHDLEYQSNTNQELNKSVCQHFLNMNLRSAPFNLTADEISKLSFEYQSENIQLISAASITNNLHNAYLLPVQQNVQTTNQISISSQSTNVQFSSTSKSHKINKKHGTMKSKITAKQHDFANSSLTMHTSIQHMQINSTKNQEQLHKEDHRETNMLVKQYNSTTCTNILNQQTSHLLQVTRPGTSQLLQNTTVQQEHQVQLQHCIESNINEPVTNVQQQQLLLQSRSNTNLAKGNIQQRLSPQTNIRSSSINVTQPSSSKQSHKKS